MILCKECFKFDEPWEEAMFDHYQWADATEDFDDPHGRFCDVCGREFDDGELVALTEGDISSFKEIAETEMIERIKGGEIMLPNSLKLFVADVVDDTTGEQEFWYVVGETYDAALDRFIKWANDWWSATYSYYFYEADCDVIEDFLDRYENITAGIYEA